MEEAEVKTATEEWKPGDRLTKRMIEWCQDQWRRKDPAHPKENCAFSVNEPCTMPRFNDMPVCFNCGVPCSEWWQNLEKTFHKNCPLPRPSQLRGNTWRIEWGGCIIWTKGSDITNDLKIASQRISSLLLGLPRRAAPLDYVRSYIFSKFYHYRQFRLISALVSCFHIISLFSIVIVVIRVRENLCRSRNPFFPWGSGEGELEGGDVAIDNFTFLIFIIITVIYRWVNNRLICKFVKNDAQSKEKMFATMFLH